MTDEIKFDKEKELKSLSDFLEATSILIDTLTDDLHSDDNVKKFSAIYLTRNLIKIFMAHLNTSKKTHKQELMSIIASFNLMPKGESND